MICLSWAPVTLLVQYLIQNLTAEPLFPFTRLYIRYKDRRMFFCFSTFMQTPIARNVTIINAESLSRWDGRTRADSNKKKANENVERQHNIWEHSNTRARDGIKGHVTALLTDCHLLLPFITSVCIFVQWWVQPSFPWICFVFCFFNVLWMFLVLILSAWHLLHLHPFAPRPIWQPGAKLSLQYIAFKTHLKTKRKTISSSIFSLYSLTYFFFSCGEFHKKIDTTLMAVRYEAAVSS